MQHCRATHVTLSFCNTGSGRVDRIFLLISTNMLLVGEKQYIPFAWFNSERSLVMQTTDFCSLKLAKMP